MTWRAYDRVTEWQGPARKTLALAEKDAWAHNRGCALATKETVMADGSTLVVVDKRPDVKALFDLLATGEPVDEETRHAVFVVLSSLRVALGPERYGFNPEAARALVRQMARASLDDLSKQTAAIVRRCDLVMTRWRGWSDRERTFQARWLVTEIRRMDSTFALDLEAARRIVDEGAARNQRGRTIAGRLLRAGGSEIKASGRALKERISRAKAL
jgi:hypothetical protein